MNRRFLFAFILSTIGVLVFTFDEKRRKAVFLFVKENKRSLILAFNLTVPFMSKPVYSEVIDKDPVNTIQLITGKDQPSVEFVSDLDKIKSLESIAFSKRQAAEQLRTKVVQLEQKCLKLRERLLILERKADKAQAVFEKSRNEFLPQQKENDFFSEQEQCSSNDDSDFESFDTRISSPKRKNKYIHFHKKGLASYLKFLWTPKSKNPKE